MMMRDYALTLQEISSRRTAGLPAGTTLAIWPVGSLEQHGPHLPLGTDALVLDAIVQGARSQLGASFPGLFLPLLPLGKSPEHLAFPGTISLRPTTLIAIAQDVIASLAEHGFRHFVFLNGHGGNAALLQSLAFDFRHEFGVFVYNIDLWASPFFNEIIVRLYPDLKTPEVHAATVETSLLLYLHPELVGEIPPVHSVRSFAQPVPYGWTAQDFDPSGVIGDPGWASAEAGKTIFEFAVDQTCELLKSIIPTE